MARETFKDLIKKLVEGDAFRGWVISSPLAMNNAWPLYELEGDELKMAEHVAFLKGYPLFDDVPSEEWWFLLQQVFVREIMLH